MKFKDSFLALLIIVIFLCMFLFSVLSVGLKKIEKKWPEYRCNPVAMPFAAQFGHDPVKNFVSCISSIQTNMMGFFLQPIHFVVSMLGELGGIITKAIQKIRELQNFVRDAVSGITGDIFGVFMNVLIQFQRLIMGIKDLVAKILGTSMVIMYLINSQMLLGKSIMKGPIGGVLRALCFHPETELKLKSGESVMMKDIKLGAILENGSKVKAVLRIDGGKEHLFYKIYSEKTKKFIYVTAEHKIKHPESDKFINVEDYKGAIKTDEYSEELSCLVTDNHLIPIGEHIFWDWED
tara:strand:+ start:71 stop:949 length:879 start_codon:yes stop_codon:yes gene_type:complete